MKNSKLFNLNKFDYIKGAVTAAIFSILAYAYTVIDSGSLEFDWKLILKIGLGAFISYLLKNFFTNKEGKPLQAEDKE